MAQNDSNKVDSVNYKIKQSLVLVTNKLEF